MTVSGICMSYSFMDGNACVSSACFIFVLAGLASGSSSQVLGTYPSGKAELLYLRGCTGLEAEPGNSQKGL